MVQAQAGGAGPGGFAPPPGGFAPPPGAPSGGGPGGKPITGSPQTVALHAMTLDPNTGLPRGEKPPASTASLVAIACGFLLCLGPLTGFAAIIAGVLGRRAARDPQVGGATLSLVGIILGALNVIGWSVGGAIWILTSLL